MEGTAKERLMGDEATAGRGLTANDGRRAMLDAGFDEADSVIVAELRRDGRATLSDLAKATSLSPSSVQSRIRKLERRGVLIGDRVQIDYHKAGLPISAFVSVLPLDYFEESEIPDRLRELEGVMSCYSVAGDPSYLLLVRVSSPEALEDLLGDIHRVVPVSTRSMVVLKTYYQDLF